jgi:hypothetical protein
MRALHSLPAFLQAPVATVSAVAMFAAAACAPPAVSDSAPVAAMGGVGPEASGVSGLHAFVDVTVIPMDRERVLERQTVVVGEGRIINIGPSTSVMVPEGATRIDGRGRFLIPGLAEMHAHIPGPQNAEWAEDVLTLYVAAGVTFARGMLGHPTHLELRERAAAGELLAPTIYTSGPSINGNSAPDVETVERMVREQKAAGYDFLKVHPGPSREVYDRMVAMAREVGIEFAGHVPADVGLQRALEARQETVDHLDGYMELLLPPGSSVDGPTGFFGMALTDRVDPARIPAVARATREADVWNVPTQSLIENLASEVPAERMAEQPAMRYVPRAIVDGWIQAKRNFQGAETFDAASAARFVETPSPADPRAPRGPRRSAARQRCSPDLQRAGVRDPPGAEDDGGRRADALPGAGNGYPQPGRVPRAGIGVRHHRARPTRGPGAPRREPARRHHRNGAHRGGDGARPLAPRARDRGAAGADCRAIRTVSELCRSEWTAPTVGVRLPGGIRPPGRPRLRKAARSIESESSGDGR